MDTRIHFTVHCTNYVRNTRLFIYQQTYKVSTFITCEQQARMPLAMWYMLMFLVEMYYFKQMYFDIYGTGVI